MSIFRMFLTMRMTPRWHFSWKMAPADLIFFFFLQMNIISLDVIRITEIKPKSLLTF